MDAEQPVLGSSWFHSDATLSDSMRHEIQTYCSGMRDIQPENLVGIYVGGSLVRGCFCREYSDIDLVIVVRAPYSDNSEAEIKRIAGECSLPIDATCITLESFKSNVLPTKIIFLIKPVNGSTLTHKPEGSYEFLLQKQDLYQAGKVFCGAPLSDIVEAVPDDLLEECLDYLFPYLSTCFKHPMLMLCRYMYTYTMHKQCSKLEAGLWGIDCLPNEWRTTIESALDSYERPEIRRPNDTSTVRLFADFASAYVSSIKKSKAERVT